MLKYKNQLCYFKKKAIIYLNLKYLKYDVDCNVELFLNKRKVIIDFVVYKNKKPLIYFFVLKPQLDPYKKRTQIIRQKRKIEKLKPLISCSGFVYDEFVSFKDFLNNTLLQVS